MYAGKFDADEDKEHGFANQYPEFLPEFKFGEYLCKEINSSVMVYQLLHVRTLKLLAHGLIKPLGMLPALGYFVPSNRATMPVGSTKPCANNYQEQEQE